MKGPRLLIRADANPEIGFGHVMRCLALAQQWNAHAAGPVTFACHEPPPQIGSRLDHEGFQLATIDHQPGTPDDAGQTIGLANEIDAMSIVLDGYDFSTNFQSLIHTAARQQDCCTLVVDDYAHLESYHCDLLLNQNTGVHDPVYQTKTNDDTKLLIGPEYALLRREFLQIDPANKIKSEQTRVLISLGGSDQGGVTQKVIDGLATLSDGSLRFTVLSSATDLRIEDNRIDLVPFVDNVAELYRDSDLAICAGGSTNWELSWFGVPRLVIVLAENQLGIASSLEQLGCCRSLGWHHDLDSQSIANGLSELMAGDLPSLRARNRMLVDGRGGRRVVQELVNKLQVKLGR